MGIETLPSAAVSGIASGIETDIGSASPGLASIGESSFSSLGSTFSSLPDSGGSFLPGFTVEGLKGLPEMTFGAIKPSLDTFLPSSPAENSGIFTISAHPENTGSIISPEAKLSSLFDHPSINLQPETEALRPSISVVKNPFTESLVAQTAPTGFHAEFLQYPALGIPSFMEPDSDAALLGKIRSFVETSGEFSTEEQLIWKQKLRTALEQKTLKVEPAVEAEVETEAATETKLQTLTMTQMETPPPIPPTTVNLSELQPEDEVEEEKEWKVFYVEPRWVIAKDIVKQREDTIDRAVQHNPNGFSHVDSVRGKIAGLDILNPYQSLKIASGELVIPQVVAKIDYALNFVDGNDTQEIANTAYDIVQKNAPQQKNKMVRFIERVKQSQLTKPARIFAEMGAKYIVLRRATMQWESRKRLTRTEPIELEKVKKETPPEIQAKAA